tara:strand:+ start:3489 stop:4223 length:735 start_codon:yes stop_codon:yes gene_type:complete
MSKIIGLIPSRLESRRLKNKPLLILDKIPLIIHTYKRALLSKKLDEVFVCTDNEKIIQVLKKYNCKYIKTKKNFTNGTDRIASVVSKFKNIRLFIDIQGDEPLINPHDIDKLIDFHTSNNQYDIVVPCLKTKKTKSKNIVKIIKSKNNIIYMTRLDAPCDFVKKTSYYKHLSVISFKPDALKKFPKLKNKEIESIESIELMRAIENFFKLGTFVSKSDSFSIDIKSDYFKAKKQIKKDKFRKLY